MQLVDINSLHKNCKKKFTTPINHINQEKQKNLKPTFGWRVKTQILVTTESKKKKLPHTKQMITMMIIKRNISIAPFLRFAAMWCNGMRSCRSVLCCVCALLAEFDLRMWESRLCYPLWRCREKTEKYKEKIQPLFIQTSSLRIQCTHTIAQSGGKRERINSREEDRIYILNGMKS